MSDNEKRVSLFISGDAVIHESVYLDALQENNQYDFDRQFHFIREMISCYDLKYYNQETILGGKELGLSGYPTFNSPIEFGEYMTDIGFNLISTATNHCLDMGMKGVQNSSAFLRSKYGVLTDGTAASWEEKNTIASMEVNGINVAFLSWCGYLNHYIPETPFEVNYFYGHEEEMLACIRRAKENSDVVILALHWGEEYTQTPEPWQRSLAEQCIQAGADVIIGNHVHVIQPFEMIHGAPVFYAMGNLISSQLNPENLISMVAGMDLVLKEENGIKQICIQNLCCDFLYTSMQGTYPALRTNIEVLPFSKLNDSILPGYRKIQDKLAAHVQSMNSPIIIGGVGLPHRNSTVPGTFTHSDKTNR